MIKFECAMSQESWKPAPPKPQPSKTRTLFKRVFGGRKRQVTSPNVKPARCPTAADSEMLLV